MPSNELLDRLDILMNRYNEIYKPIEKELLKAYHVRAEIDNVIAELKKLGVEIKPETHDGV